MNKWEMARYIIDSKKDIDTMMYIEKYGQDLANLDIQEYIDSVIRQFYLSCCYVLDYYCENNISKKELCSQNKIVDSIYYERDKNIGHKDKNYKWTRYDTITEHIAYLKKQLEEVRKVCSSILPSVLTLDYVPHNKLLFRFVTRLNPQLELDLLKIKYPNAVYHSYQLSEEGRHYFKDYDTSEHDRENFQRLGIDYDDLIEKKIIGSPDDIKHLSEEEKTRYAVLIENGLNSFEGVQNRQDSCIKINLMYDKDIWVTPNWDLFNQIEEGKKSGFYDEFELPHFDKS